MADNRNENAGVLGAVAAEKKPKRARSRDDFTGKQRKALKSLEEFEWRMVKELSGPRNAMQAKIQDIKADVGSLQTVIGCLGHENYSVSYITQNITNNIVHKTIYAAQPEVAKAKSTISPIMGYPTTGSPNKSSLPLNLNITSDNEVVSAESKVVDSLKKGISGIKTGIDLALGVESLVAGLSGASMLGTVGAVVVPALAALAPIIAVGSLGMGAAYWSYEKEQERIRELTADLEKLNKLRFITSNYINSGTSDLGRYENIFSFDQMEQSSLLFGNELLKGELVDFYATQADPSHVTTTEDVERLKSLYGQMNANNEGLFDVKKSQRDDILEQTKWQIVNAGGDAQRIVAAYQQGEADIAAKSDDMIALLNSTEQQKLAALEDTYKMERNTVFGSERAALDAQYVDSKNSIRTEAEASRQQVNQERSAISLMVAEELDGMLQGNEDFSAIFDNYKADVELAEKNYEANLLLQYQREEEPLERWKEQPDLLFPPMVPDPVPEQYRAENVYKNDLNDAVENFNKGSMGLSEETMMLVSTYLAAVDQSRFLGGEPDAGTAQKADKWTELNKQVPGPLMGNGYMLGSSTTVPNPAGVGAAVGTGDFQGIMQSAQAGLSAGTEPLMLTVQEITGSITSAFESIDLTSEGTNIVQGLIDGINSMREPLSIAVAALASLVPEGVQAVLVIRSPSQVMREDGEFAAQGLIEGLQHKIPQTVSMSERLAQAVALPEQAPGNPSAVAGVAGGLGSGSNGISGVQNSYEASFNIQFSGGTGNMDEPYTVKATIMEALNEWAESMQRTSPQLVEA